MVVANGELISTGNQVGTELVFPDAQGDSNGIVLAFIKIISSAGGIRFAVGDAPGAVQKLWVTDDYFPMSFKPGVKNLWCDQTADADTFVITF